MGFGTRIALFQGMQAPSDRQAAARTLIDAALAGRVTESQAEELSTFGQEAGKLALLARARPCLRATAHRRRCCIVTCRMQDKEYQLRWLVKDQLNR